MKITCSICAKSTHLIFCNCVCTLSCLATEEILEDPSLFKNILYFLSLNIPYITKALVIRQVRININKKEEEIAKQKFNPYWIKYQTQRLLEREPELNEINEEDPLTPHTLEINNLL